MTRYKILFEVEMYHEYYRNFFGRDYDIVLPGNLRNLMNSYQLFFKKSERGFQIICKEDQEYLLKKFNENLVFTFGIKLTNRNFENFSDVLPSKPLRKYIFTSPLDDQNVGNRISLHNNKYVDKSDFGEIFFPSDLLSERFSEFLTIKQGSEELFSGEISQHQRVSDICSDSYGKYLIVDDEKGVEYQAFYIDEQLRSCWGIIQIDFSSLVSPNTKFRLQINSRFISWTYYFISDYVIDKSIDMFWNKKKIEFSAPEKVSIVNGRTAFKITSKEQIQLFEIYDSKRMSCQIIAHTLENIDQPINLQKDLPTPDITRIKAFSTEEKIHYFSEMYIYDL